MADLAGRTLLEEKFLIPSKACFSFDALKRSVFHLFSFVKTICFKEEKEEERSTTVCICKSSQVYSLALTRSEIGNITPP